MRLDWDNIPKLGLGWPTCRKSRFLHTAQHNGFVCLFKENTGERKVRVDESSAALTRASNSCVKRPCLFKYE
jgi:hypothetical protein